MSKENEPHGSDTSEVCNDTQQKMEVVEDDRHKIPKYHPPNKDGGYGWVIVASNILVHFLFATVLRTFGILYLALLEKFDTTPTVAGWIGALCMTTLGVFGPITSQMCRHLSCRTVTIIGSLANATGLVITAFAPNIVVVFLSLGFISCAGASLTYVPGFVLVNQYFDKKKALAMGLSTIGSGIGTFVTPPLIQYLFSHFGFSGTMLLLAAVNLHSCISGALQRPFQVGKAARVELSKNGEAKYDHATSNYAKRDQANQLSPLMKGSEEETQNISFKTTDTDDDAIVLNGSERFITGKDPEMLDSKFTDTNNLKVITYKYVSENDNSNYQIQPQEEYHHGNNRIKTETSVFFKNSQVISVTHTPAENNKCSQSGLCRFCDLALVTDPLFLGLFAINFSSGVAMCVSSAFMPALAYDRGVALPKAAFLLSITGACDAATRLTAALILDAKFIRRHRVHVYNCANSLLGAGALLTCFAHNFPLLAVATALKGVGSGLILSQRGTISADLMGEERMSKAVGLMLLSGSLGALVGRGLGGAFKDLTGSYVPDFYLSAAVTLVCSLLFWLALRKKKPPG